MFKGDIAKFSPADLLMFLAHLDKEGMLTVTKGNEGLSIGFKNGFIVDAHSEIADGKSLRALYFRKLIDKDKFSYISRVKKETGLPLKQILEDADLISDGKVREILEVGIKEVFFQFFLWENGQFQFAEIGVEQNDCLPSYPCQSLMLETARRVDEYRETIRSISSLESMPTATPAGREAADASFLERFAVSYADGKNTVRWILAACPSPSYEALNAVAGCLDRGWIEFVKTEPRTVPAGSVTGRERLFVSYKRSLKKIILAAEKRVKIAETVNFCKDFFEYSLILALKDGKLARGTRFSRDPQGQLQRADIRNNQARVDKDDIFQWVQSSNLAFFGKTFTSNLIERIEERPPDGECAIIPLGKIDDLDFFIYVASAGAVEEPGPFQYLEMLSWHVNPPVTEFKQPLAPPQAATSEKPPAPAPRKTGQPQPEKVMKRMVEAVKELPPMPDIINRILQLLSDPDSKISDLTAALSRDQTLVARLIKVSNSALYGRGQKISALDQAVTRLGTRTIRSLVMAAYTRSLFPMDQANVGIWGQSLWQHSLECGTAARRIADLVRYQDPEEAFVGGVLHDIGKVVILLNMPDDYRLISKKQASSTTRSIDAEMHVLGFDHTQVGEMLLQKWNMPQNLKACIRYHHDVQHAGDFDNLVQIVAYGDFLSHAHGAQPDENQVEERTDIDLIVENLKLSDEQILALQEKTTEEFEYSDILG